MKYTRVIYPFIPDIIICLTPYGPAWRFRPKLSKYHISIVWRSCICIYHVVQIATLPPTSIGIWKLYSYQMYILITGSKLEMHSSWGENDIAIKNHMHNQYESMSRSLYISDCIIFFKLQYNTELYNWYSYVDYRHTHFQYLISSMFA